jgi:lipopolysaccharide transport system permease protein
MSMALGTVPLARFRSAFSDLGQSLKRLQLAYWLGFRETLLLYRIAKIGPLWMTIHTGFWALAVGYLLGPSIGHGDPSYFIYVTLGFALFSTFQIFIGDGAGVFVRAGNFILNVPNPFLVYVIKVGAKASIQVVMVAPVVVVAMLYARQPIALETLLVIPGLLLCGVFGIGVTLFLGTIAVRNRDVIFAVGAGMRLLLFITPIFWIVEDRSGTRGLVADANPLYHLITLVREPIMGVAPDPLHWMFGGASAVAALTIGFLTFAWFRGRMAIWL